MTDPADQTETLAGDVERTTALPAAPPVVLGGRYELTERIASGGMATVWLGRDEVLARRVAVKMLHDHLAADEAFRERFRREAIAAARLTHPNVVNLYDTGTDGDRVYLVMEFVEGATLRDVIAARGTLDVGDAASVGEKVARALDYAHERGLVHRDVKPANILIGDDGAVKVADFGIAKAEEAGADLTGTGMVLGTAAYVAPEQITGTSAVDGRADQYALGCMLYEALTGRQPFKGDSAVATAAKRLSSEPAPLRSVRADVPRGLDAVVMRALGRRPEDRFPSAGSLADALLPFADANTAQTAALASGWHATPATGTPAHGRPADEGAARAGAADAGSADADAGAGSVAASATLAGVGSAGAGLTGPGSDPVGAGSADTDTGSGDADASSWPQPAAAATRRLRSPAAPAGAREAPPTSARPDPAPRDAAGRLVPAAGTETVPPAPARPAPAARDPERRWLLPVLVLVLLAGALVGLALATGMVDGGNLPELSSPGTDPPSGSEPPAGAARAEPLTVTAVSGFDPPSPPGGKVGGDGEENDADLGALTDGEAATTWRTDLYRSADFGGLKDGVGFSLDLGRVRPLSAVELTTTTPGINYELRIADERPEHLDGWRRVATVTNADAETTVTFDEPVRGRHLLVWVVGPLPGTPYKAEFATVTVLGPPA